MVDRKTWKEFRESGLLWFINTILHMFGWAIVVDVDMEDNNIKECYTAKVKFRGFKEEHNTEGYIKVTEHLKENIDKLIEDIKE
jgi:hypothetical protein